MPTSTIRPSPTITTFSAFSTVVSRCATAITGPLPAQPLQRREQLGLRLVVQRRRPLVEYQDVRTPVQRTRDGEPLALPAGDPDAALTDDRLEPLRQRRDHGVELGEPDGLGQGLLVDLGIGDPQGDVAAQRVVGQEDRL